MAVVACSVTPLHCSTMRARRPAVSPAGTLPHTHTHTHEPPFPTPHPHPHPPTRSNGASFRLMWEAENNGGTPTPFAYVYVPSGSKREQPPELQDSERCGQRLFEGAFRGTTLQVRAVRCGVLRRGAPVAAAAAAARNAAAGAADGGSGAASRQGCNTWRRVECRAVSCCAVTSRPPHPPPTACRRSAGTTSSWACASTPPARCTRQQCTHLGKLQRAGSVHESSGRRHARAPRPRCRV